MKVVSFKPLVKGALRGFLTVELPSGIVMHECTVIAPEGRDPFIGLPSKPQIGRDGRAAMRDGKRQYEPAVTTRDKATGDKLSAAIIAALLREHPDALDGEVAR